MKIDNTLRSYFESIEKQVKDAYNIAGKARALGKDPEPEVNIPIARDLAARVEGLVGTMEKNLIGSGLAERIRELEKEYGKNDERVALLAGRDVALQKTVRFEDRIKAIEFGLRVAIAYLTLGVVTAPLEGLSEVRLKKNSDGTEYLAIYFAGPIRSAGGTASAMAVLAADFIRTHCGIGAYIPRDLELKRYSTEVEDYYTRITPKQYHPTKEEIEFIISNIPVEINGDPTETLEVSNFKDLERVETNRIRGGMCLVLLDGLPLKAEKMLKRIMKYPADYQLKHWLWLKKFIAMKKKIHAAPTTEEKEHARYMPNAKYVDKIIAGRPVISYPAKEGGFRLRYGRSRTGGLASTSIHPLTMHLIPFLAVGTQIAMELPGKATVCTPCDTIEGPVVRLKTGDVLEPGSREEIDSIRHEISEILSVGDVLIPYGEFVSNGHMLLPASYVEEWWSQEVSEALQNKKKNNPEISEHLKKPYPPPSLEKAIEISKSLSVPLHPFYNFFWHDIEKSDLKSLIEWFSTAKNEGSTLVLEKKSQKTLLDRLCAPHTIKGDKIILQGKSLAIHTCLGSPCPENTAALHSTVDSSKDVMDALKNLSGMTIIKKGPVRVGMKMGRPEKAERRLLKGRPQVLFPCGETGGRMRNLMESYKAVELESSVSVYRCTSCRSETYYPRCHRCGSPAKEATACRICNRLVDSAKHCGSPTVRYRNAKLNIKQMMDSAKEKLSMKEMPDLFKGVRGVFGINRNIEPLEKGLLRAKHDLYVNKDGTTRADSTDVSLTHFRPREIGVPVEKLKSLGYTKDTEGKELENDEQVLELFPQDIIISDNSDFSTADYMIKISRFTDDLLTSFYGSKPYYRIKSKQELVGKLVIGLAPHTSAGIIGRIIGFTPARVCFAHPFWHAGKRRNCDGDEDSVMLLMDALLNFSRQFMPDTRGGRTMDAPLVLTTCLDPEEVDDESWNVDVDSTYPLGFYKATLGYPNIWEIISKPRIISELIGTSDVFHISFTHDTHDISEGPKRSRYTELETMAEKLYAQLNLAKKLRAVDENRVAEAVLTKHFLRDIKGNLRKFSKQGFRCGACNEKFRRIPLIGRCTRCNGKILLTISEGSTRKYLEPSKRIMDDFRITSYLRQQFLLLEKEADSIFGKKARQLSLSKFS